MYKLQWGRNFIVTEMVAAVLATCFDAIWLQWGRNFIVAEMLSQCLADGAARGASMGPQLYRCGNRDHDGETLADITPLQWGRNFIVTEMVRTMSSVYTITKLQWGRNFIVAEI